MARRSWLLFAAMCIIWGIPYLLIRVAVRDVAPGTLVFARTAIGGLILLPLALRGGGFAAVLRRWRPLAAFTVIEVAVRGCCFPTLSRSCPVRWPGYWWPPCR